MQAGLGGRELEHRAVHGVQGRAGQLAGQAPLVGEEAVQQEHGVAEAHLGESGGGLIREAVQEARRIDAQRFQGADEQGVLGVVRVGRPDREVGEDGVEGAQDGEEALQPHVQGQPAGHQPSGPQPFPPAAKCSRV